MPLPNAPFGVYMTESTGLFRVAVEGLPTTITESPFPLVQLTVIELKVTAVIFTAEAFVVGSVARATPQTLTVLVIALVLAFEIEGALVVLPLGLAGEKRTVIVVVFTTPPVWVKVSGDELVYQVVPPSGET